MPNTDRFMSNLAGRILAVESFDAKLPEILESAAEHFEVDFAGCCVARRGKRREFGWDRASGNGRRLSAWPWARMVEAGAVETRLLPEAEDLLRKSGFREAVIADVGLDSHDSLHVILGREQPKPCDDDAEIAESIGAFAATLGLAVSRENFKEQALVDPLTDLFNRRYLDAALPGELDRSKRFRSALTVMILDVDHFKEINDDNGHQHGDRLLRELADIISDSIRSSDAAVRYGGDEFVILFPATPLAGVERVSERIQGKVRSLNVTLSGGLAAAHPQATSQSLLVEADDRLYEAKRRGRDRLILPPPSSFEFPAPQSFFGGIKA